VAWYVFQGLMGQTTYHMYLQNGDLFLLAGRLRKKTKNSHYVISTDAGVFPTLFLAKPVMQRL